MLRSLRPDPVLIQALIAGSLSFAHLHDLAEAAGQHGWKAWAYPISVDLLLVAAWRRMRTLRAGDDSATAAWVWFIIALAASLGANIATAGLLDMNHIPAVLRIIVAGWPALAFLGGTLLAHSPTPANTPEPAPAPTAVPSDPEPVADITVDRAPEPAPELPAPVPKVPSMQVPPALVEHARKVADTHRATTGAPIDTDTLRARLGVPAPMADAIAAQLT
ncbi:DUF2637 domain-containing protein [Streptomyces sp. MK37H]|uniref:DUF2637 domain-containing protein n=1 Tax=Streptomyces sp. MK37H TaxID=2699117 RepID=UPI001B35C11F|nr:DUF2637 domain-containing protein [Streptomyces sp. MK37H]MBP8534360.1 DUF2637 domain-containing protein [Streptomyces sp. MK37H]